MNHAMITSLAHAHQADLRAAALRHRQTAQPGPAVHAGRRPARPRETVSVRQRLGHILVETGLHLLASPAPRS